MAVTTASVGAPVPAAPDAEAIPAPVGVTRVVMLAHISGTRNGVPWPLPGQVFEVPASEARDLMHNHLAKPAPEPEEAAVEPEAEPERAVEPEPEEAAVIEEAPPEKAVIHRARKRK